MLHAGITMVTVVFLGNFLGTHPSLVPFACTHTCTVDTYGVQTKVTYGFSIRKNNLACLLAIY